MTTLRPEIHTYIQGVTRLKPRHCFIPMFMRYDSLHDQESLDTDMLC